MTRENIEMIFWCFLAIFAVWQFVIFIKSAVKINRLKNIFDGEDLSLGLSGDNMGRQIILDANDSLLLRKIKLTINKYIDKKMDIRFEDIKNLVELECLPLEEEIDSSIPIPLYLGLMGTMGGIALSVIPLAFSPSGGVSFDMLKPLLKSVGFSMLVSLMGLIWTTILSGKISSDKKEFQQKKNAFLLSFYQDIMPFAVGIQGINANNITGAAVDIVRKIAEANQQVLWKFHESSKNFEKIIADIRKLNGETSELMNDHSVRARQLNETILECEKKSVELAKNAREWYDANYDQLNKSIDGKTDEARRELITLGDNITRYLGEVADRFNSGTERQKEAIDNLNITVARLSKDIMQIPTAEGQVQYTVALTKWLKLASGAAFAAAMLAIALLAVNIKYVYSGRSEAAYSETVPDHSVTPAVKSEKGK